MNIFNSLGSNYDFPFALGVLLAKNKTKYKASLIETLEKKYGGKAYPFYKGRDAITSALKSLNLKSDSAVAINGFTCYAVYNAVEKAGLNPVMLDISRDKLNFSAKYLEKSILENPKIKVVIIQNTLGFPCEIEKISKICKKNNLILIEDLAHSAGCKYESGKSSGTFGDFVVLSFSQDKIIDAISGGALIVRNKELPYKESSIEIKNSNSKDRLYPLFSYAIRKFYPILLGKILHKSLKSSNLLSKPMESRQLNYISNWYFKLVISEFKNLEENIDHRKEIAKIYLENLPKELLIKDSQNIDLSTNLRFPILIENRNEVIAKLKQKGIYLSDIWYDAPIAPKLYMDKIDYKNNCPNSEFVSSRILNLPTHINVSKQQAVEVFRILKQCLT